VRAVSDMHQRKAEMARQADAFIALPGMKSSHKTLFFFFLILCYKIRQIFLFLVVFLIWNRTKLLELYLFGPQKIQKWTF
jgi:hypothetical protein